MLAKRIFAALCRSSDARSNGIGDLYIYIKKERARNSLLPCLARLMRIYEAKMVEEGARIRKRARKRELMGYSILEKSDNIADIPCINNALRYGNLPFAISVYV